MVDFIQLRKLFILATQHISTILGRGDPNEYSAIPLYRINNTLLRACQNVQIVCYV
jgi:hypothetical protein